MVVQVYKKVWIKGKNGYHSTEFILVKHKIVEAFHEVNF